MINHCVNIIFGLHIACILSTNWVLGEKSGYDTLQYYSAPLVISTWPFVEAASQAYHVLDVGGSALSAIVAGCSECQKLQCDGTVGFGGSPDESGETSLDAMLMDGDSMDVGAVANLRNVRDAIEVARFVLENTEHSLLAGFEASEFAVRMGLRYYDSLSTPKSRGQYEEWKSKKCQPNFWRNVRPDSRKACGPYHPFGNVSRYPTSLLEDQPKSHDTISMIALDRLGSLASGSSTNGLRHKIPGRVGDAAVPGAGSYADGDVGACAATGDGDVTMRFLPCYQVIENLKRGMTVQDATDDAMYRIVQKIKGQKIYEGALVAYDVRRGSIGATRVGKNFNFSYTVRDKNGLRIVPVPALQGENHVIKK